MMRPLPHLIIPAIFFLLSVRSLAQCPGCTQDVTCTASPAYPTLCPAQPPAATAGEFYETDITFWLPTEFTDPGTGFDVTFEEMTIVSVTGLPFGLSLETSSPDGIYFPQQDQYGCARICGTPVGPGTFDITISIIASVSFTGINIDAPEQFTIPLEVLPGSGGNNSFTFTPTSGCGSVEVAFEALIDASPAPMAYDWDFGDGTTGTEQAPVVLYDEPGTYSVSLQTTIQGYVLNAVAVNGVNGNWCGDVEEPFCNCGTPIIGTCPDLYFVLSNAAGAVFTSNTIDGETSATWSNIDLLLADPPYSITFWDEDAISNDDNLGTYDLVLTAAGDLAFNVAGGTNGSVAIAIQPVQTFNDTDVVMVFPLPEVVLALDPPSGELCVQGTDLGGFQWFLDGALVEDLSDPCILPTAPGLWQVVATDGFGCSNESNVVVICPEVTITRDGPILSVAEGFLAYSWTFNGVPLPGAEGASIQAGPDGTYAVVVLAENDCEVEAFFEYSTVGIADLEDGAPGLLVYPIPNDGLFTVEAAGLTGARAWVRVLDMGGREVFSQQEATATGRIRLAVMLDLAPGAYAVQVQDETRTLVQRIVVR